MAKAVLIMDMPESCTKCNFCENLEEGWLHCSLKDKTALAFNRPDWCPLHELPKKRVKHDFLAEAIKNECYDETESDQAYFEGKKAGWNACIDKMIRQ